MPLQKSLKFLAHSHTYIHAHTISISSRVICKKSVHVCVCVQGAGIPDRGSGESSWEWLGSSVFCNSGRGRYDDTSIGSGQETTHSDR